MMKSKTSCATSRRHVPLCSTLSILVRSSLRNI